MVLSSVPAKLVSSSTIRGKIMTPAAQPAANNGIRAPRKP